MSKTNKLFKIGDIVLEQKNPYLKLKIEQIENKIFHCSILQEETQDRKLFKEDEIMLDDSIANQ
jgi:hypothetical protein